MEQVKVVENGVEAKREIEQLIMQGFTKDEIYLLAHDKHRSEDLTDSLDIGGIGVGEQGVFDSIANVFRTRGDELRSKLESLGLSHAEAEHYEEELDQGRVVVVASKSA
ncbi:general stress protein [Neobacillus sp. MM2021_6]|uniref:general stress protein n=1 Tax=Bacillaceae TaxID=186817 RepID=UPI00140E2D11|nr:MULTISPECIES: general stress protein [Bacillaceae]MBO0960977.1 general stress protein [Neobacillus sp. MM2021_6]NHC19111.1 general stress protein [Bacillus sp. MM2020_4]WML41595.1 general stress protein [Neobacillus sp. OS1-2]